MSSARLVVLTLLLVAVSARGDVEENKADKVTNDRPDRPLQMPPASTEVKEAFDDFERFRKRNAWERALKSLYTIPEEQALRFVDGKDGFIIPVASKRRAVLAELPPEGQVAYRLFYDDEAKKLLEQADGALELKTLERIYSAYFPSSVGDNAADRLGDLYFEMGRFDRAADCWLAVLRDRPDTDLAPALLSVKAALALFRAERRAELAAVRREVEDRYAQERVSIGGKTAPAAEQLRRYLGGEGQAKGSAAGASSPSGSAGGSGTEPGLGRETPAAWQMRFGESVVAGMTPPERVQWESNPLSGAVPPVAVEGNVLYANFLGYVFAINVESGKLIWRSASFHNVEVPASQDQARMIDPARFAIVASKEHVWTLSRELKDPNQLAPFRLTCRRTDGGDVVWQSTDLPDYAQLDLVGTPVLAGGTLFVVAKPPMNYQQGPLHQYVLAVRSHDGKVLWKTEIGTFRQGQRFFYYGMRDSSPQPMMLFRAGSIYVDTHAGVLARLDAESGELEWGYGYQTEPAESSSRFFFWGMMQQSESSSSTAPVRSGEALFVKGAKSDRIYALDSDRMKVLWDRPIAKSARLLGADDRAVYLGGPELSALDLRSRTLTWATRLPGGSAEGRILARSGGLWQLTARGIFEIDPRSGRVRRIFRGDDTGSDGGDLYWTERLLLAVSNRTISAYPLATTTAGGPGGGDEGLAGTKTRASND
ncbi:MAG: PQQ-binding-like beta-propeller repeat protein [Isosphaeraceae bacterium]|nr:PQQ-binding-like beta-propeller repeat protein [Isosphaeraceae bacterium]